MLALNFLQAQNSVGLNINNEDLELTGSIDLNQMTGYVDTTSYIADLDYLNTSDDDMVMFGIRASNQFQGFPGLSLSLGVKSVITQNFIAFPFTFGSEYLMPLIDTIPPVSWRTNLCFAPEVLSFSDGRSYLELRTELDMEVITNVHLFVGYRKIDTEYKTKDTTFNSSGYLGMKLHF